MIKRKALYILVVPQLGNGKMKQVSRKILGIRREYLQKGVCINSRICIISLNPALAPALSSLRTPEAGVINLSYHTIIGSQAARPVVAVLS